MRLKPLFSVTQPNRPNFSSHAAIVAARRRNISHGPIANRLWRYIEEQAPLLNGVSKQRSGRRM